MKFERYDPSPSLKSAIAYFWTLQSDEIDLPQQPCRLIPDGFVDWIFHFGTPWAFSFPKKETAFKTLQTHFFGHTKNYIDLKLPKGKLSLFAVKFQPWAAYHFWGLSMSEFTDLTLTFSDLEQHTLLDLEARIYEPSSILDKINLIEKFIATRMPSFQKDSLASVMFDIQTQQSVDFLGNLSVSQRRLEQRFRHEVGISPKLYQRTLRINQAIQQIIQHPESSFTSIAYQFGFFDQSHFIRDFKQFTGITPSRFLKSIQPSGDIFNLKIT